MTPNEMMTYDMIVELGIATAEELNLARNLVSGSWTEVFNRVTYIRTGYRTFEQYYFEDIMEDEEVA